MKVNIEIKGIEELDRLLDQLSEHADHMQPVMDEAGNYLQNIIEESFESGRSPDGETWSPLADSTLIQKTKDGSPQSMGKLLYDEGTLSESIGYEANNEGLTVGVNAYSKGGYPYPVVHQFGSEDGKIPARPFMPIDNDGELYEDIQEELITLITEFLT